MNYSDCLDWLYSQLPMYQRNGKLAYKADIGNIVEATKRLGNPHNNFKSLHIAGTNGKGSTSHMIASILQEAGYKTGLYTSPHLKDFRERIRINGNMIQQQFVVDFVSENKIWFTDLGMSFFEMTVALAFKYISDKKVDIAVIETGLGGRLDSTNIIQPELSIITNIGYDHMALLGNSLHEIAAEKAGIIKKNTPVVIGRKQTETEAIFKHISKSKQSEIHYAKAIDFDCDLKGNYQSENISTAFTAVNLLIQKGWKVSNIDFVNGYSNVQNNTGLIGRWTELSKNPLIICDTAHNEDSIRCVVQQIEEISFSDLHIVLGMVNDKSINTILSILPETATYYFCQANIPRALEADRLKEIAAKFQLRGNTFLSVREALSMAQNSANFDDLIFIGGSTFTVAEIL